MQAKLTLFAALDSYYTVEDLAKDFTYSCTKAAADACGECPSGLFRCPFGGDEVNCENITAADWLRILEVVHD